MLPLKKNVPFAPTSVKDFEMFYGTGRRKSLFKIKSIISIAVPEYIHMGPIKSKLVNKYILGRPKIMLAHRQR